MPADVRIEVRPGRGRCLIASKRFDPSNLVLATLPVSAVLQQSEARSRCARCFWSLDNKGGQGGNRCSGCKNIWYCSRHCQKQDWLEHRPECKVFGRKTSGATPTRTIILAARILHLMNRLDSATATALQASVGELVDHNEKRSQDQKEIYLSAAAVIARLCLEGCGSQALTWPSASGRGLPGLVDAAFGILGKVACNVFAVPSESGQDEIACGLYLEAATVNHSCAPNAVQTFHGRQLSLRCIRPILPGEEVMIGVTDLRLPGPERRQALSANFFFECRCERCHSQDAPSMDALLEGYACPDASCAGLCAKRESHIELEDESIRGDAKTEADACLMATGSTLSCDRCGALRPAGEAATGSAVIRNLLEQGKSCASQHGDYARARGYLEKAHQQATSSSGHRLHRANWILSEIYSQLVRVTLNLQDLEAATGYACEGLEADRNFWSGTLPHSIVWANQLAVTGKLLLCVRDRPTEARPLLEEALSILVVTHGVEHPMYREVGRLLSQAEHEARRGSC